MNTPTDTAATSAEREAFERWCVQRWRGDRGALERNPPDAAGYPDVYKMGNVEFAWRAWHARASLAAAPALAQADTARIDHLQRTGSTVSLVFPQGSHEWRFMVAGLNRSVHHDLRASIDIAREWDASPAPVVGAAPAAEVVAWRTDEGSYTEDKRSAEQRNAMGMKYRPLVWGDVAAPATPVGAGVPAGMVLVRSPITEDMHVAACKVLARAHGLDGTPQQMLDTMIAATQQPHAEPQQWPQPIPTEEMAGLSWDSYEIHGTASSIAEVQRLVHLAARAKCDGCNGHGMVGGLQPDGYHAEECPFCKGSGLAFRAPAAPADPLDQPLTCDITVGHVTIRKGVALRTLVTRMQVLYDMAMATPNPPGPARAAHRGGCVGIRRDHVDQRRRGAAHANADAADRRRRARARDLGRVRQRGGRAGMSKEFNDSLVDLQMQVSRAYADEVHRLRQENARLRAIIAEFPSTATELQDRVTMLECRLRAQREATS